MTSIIELRKRLGDAVDELATLVDNEAAFGAKEAEIGDINKQIARAEKVRAAQMALARPANAREAGSEGMGTTLPLGDFELSHLDSVAPREVRRARWQPQDYVNHVRRLSGFTVDPNRQFRTLGEQLRAVAHYYMGGRDVGAMDSRLVRAPTGAGEVDPSAGGFLVQTDFATSVFARAYDMGQILGRVNKLPLSTAANSIKIPAVDETSRATGSRWGGVQSNWVAEGITPGTSKPKFRLIELDLKKLMSIMYVTDEMLADSTVLTSIATQAFSDEIMFMTEDAIFEGTGAGQPLGILNSPALVTIAKEVGQATKTILYENVQNAWSHCWIRSQNEAVWLINQDALPQLNAVSLVIGSAGAPAYLPPGGLTGLPYGTLFGRPVIPTEYSSTVGTVGDIALADLSQYVLADKGGVQMAASMHVAFLTDEMVFRITYRVDGKPIWHAPLTPFKGVSTKSPFVTIAAR